MKFVFDRSGWGAIQQSPTMDKLTSDGKKRLERILPILSRSFLTRIAEHEIPLLETKLEEDLDILIVDARYVFINQIGNSPFDGGCAHNVPWLNNGRRASWHVLTGN